MLLGTTGAADAERRNGDVVLLLRALREGDGISNSQELALQSSPFRLDSDRDGASDATEVGTFGSDPSRPDTDGDGVLDGDEVTQGSDPMDTDTDGDGYPDGQDGAKRKGIVYRHQDHLGSTAVVTRSDGQVIQRVVYKPYGAMQSATGSDYAKRLGFYFTGQRYEAAVGIYDYGARFYDPAIGRFLQADTVVSEPYTPQSLNRYSYTLNSPVSWADPSGHTPIYFGSDYYEGGDGGSGQVVRTYSDDSQDQPEGFGPFAGMGGGQPYYVEIGGSSQGHHHRHRSISLPRIHLRVFDPAEWSGVTSMLSVPAPHGPQIMHLGDPGNIATALIPWILGGELIKAARMASQVKRGVSVLGHFPDYLKRAEEIGARRFSVPERIWEKMTDAERWAANRKFLDRLILRGDEVELAPPLSNMRPGSTFEREVEYLIERGYQPTPDGTMLLPGE